MVAQEEAGELKDAIIFFERNAWLLKSSGANFRNHRDETLLIVLSLMRSFPSLIFPDPMREFNAGDAERGSPKALQSNHRTQTKFDRSMVLFDEIVQIFGEPYFGPLAAPMLAEDFPRRPMRSLVTIKRDGARQPALDLERPPKNPRRPRNPAWRRAGSRPSFRSLTSQGCA